MTRWILCCHSFLVAAVLLPRFAEGVDHVSISRNGMSSRISGEVLVESQDGGLLVLDRARVLWAITPDELVSREHDPLPFEPFDKDELAEELLARMPAGSRIHTTAHYVIAYNTSRAYAEWCGALYERLHKAFGTYWERRGFGLSEPDWPLPAMIFDSKAAFTNYARTELGDSASSVIGYYSLRTNRVTMYDLTGVDGQIAGGGSSAAHINRLLARPEAERTVATVIHEATHQLAFNRGLQTRYADIPLWVSEGVAIYFETPDLRSSKGWRNIGGVNRVQLHAFRRALPTRVASALTDLIASDGQFRNPRSIPTAYADSWALNYFLIRQRPQEYLAYLKMLAEKPRLIYDEPDERLQQFREAFGEDLEQLEAEFLRYMQTVR